MSNGQTPPGWYQDPSGAGGLRWWDGAGWSAHTQPVVGAQPLDAGVASQVRSPARRARPVILIVVLFLLIGGVFGATGLVRALLASDDTTAGSGPQTSSDRPSSPEPSAASTEAPSYSMSERPQYAALSEEINRLYEEYAGAYEDGSLYGKTVPDTDNGREYAKAFIFYLTEQRQTLRFGGATSTSTGELDARIQAKQDELAEMERRFLAGEDLLFTVRYTGPDGRSFESDGSAPPPGEAAEQFAASFSAAPGPDGTYIDAAGQLAAEFGLVLNFDYDAMYLDCAASGMDRQYIIASYCSATPTMIYVNDDFVDYVTNVSSPKFVDDIRHEIAHHRITQICGSAHPSIAGSKTEAVTNSYALLFLGADRESLSVSGESFPDYAMSDWSDDVAGRISRGECD